jgi:hypothetical protein
MKKAQKIWFAYRAIVRWNRESAAELLEMIKRVMEATPAVLRQALPIFLKRYRYVKNMRFDFSSISEPVLAIDKHGNAIIGGLRTAHVAKLEVI